MSDAVPNSLTAAGSGGEPSLLDLDDAFGGVGAEVAPAKQNGIEREQNNVEFAPNNVEVITLSVLVDGWLMTSLNGAERHEEAASRRRLTTAYTCNQASPPDHHHQQHHHPASATHRHGL